jgi:nucleoside phosphorylase/DNA-binding NarL/FixJ family response regulator
MALDVLLLEDDPAKKDRLLKMLTSQKTLFGRVDTAMCANEALRHMQSRKYDLFIADVVVPDELGGEKNEKYCTALFERIDDETSGIHRPRYSLPVSASDQLTKEAYAFFAGRPWGILSYDESNDDSLTTIQRVAKFVLGEKEHADRTKCDVFLIAALMDPEFAALEDLEIRWEPLEPLDNIHMVRYAQIKSGGSELRVAAAFCTRMGPVQAAILTTKAMLTLSPSLVIMGGICAGIPGKADIGDIIVADISWDWQSGKHQDAKGVEVFQIAPHQLDIDEEMRSQLVFLKRDSEFWKKLSLLAVEQSLALPKLVIGPMATGSSVLADKRVSDRIKANQHKNVAGLDMETYGVYAAVESCNPSTRVVSMKAVCDKGDSKKDDSYQAYAAKISALAVEQFLMHYAHKIVKN